MVPHLMLLCKYGDRTIVFKVVSNCTLKDLTNFLSCKLKKFDSCGCILLSYCLPEHSQCMIDDDFDFQNMLSLVYPLSVDQVYVTITEIGISNEKHGVRKSRDASESIITDDEMDLLPMFCQHEERTLLSCGWMNGITHNEKCWVTAVCSMRESKACLWRVHASLESANNFFYIRTLNDKHTCGVAVCTSKNSRMSSNLVASLIVNEVCGNPQTHPIDVVRQFTNQYGLTITYNHAWLGVEKARTTTFGDFSMFYDEIRWNMDIVMSTNPISYLRLDYNHQSERFKRFLLRLMLPFKGLGIAVLYCFFPLAMAIVDTETIDSWEWFFMRLSNILLDERPITFISNRNAGLFEALPKVLPTAYHYFFLQHLKANLRDRFSSPSFSNTFRSKIVFLFSSCAYASTVGCFNQCLKELQDKGKGIVCKFLSNFPYDKWTNAYFIGQKYGEMHSNVTESFNSWILQARHLPTMKMIDSIRLKIMDLMSRRREQNKKWNTFLCPEMDSTLVNALKSRRIWLVSRSSDHVFEVQSWLSVSVDLLNRTCPCYQWQLNGFLCAHTATAIQKSGGDLYAHVEPFYYISKFKACYAESVYAKPIAEKPLVTMDDLIVLPPICKKPPCRPRKNRIPSRGEKIRRVQCGRCEKYGHNRKTCKETLP
ncbi:uncharacterized protein LOC114321467 [Camellia sinensis]|uniref:uncharacterized protein LOC114321467 n=1 Tax=Camellia sinensis TaxID=4442 RepID=UPI001035ACAF|nr:uncharacterized protein LOC114321467 [Camellia sinensis]